MSRLTRNVLYNLAGQAALLVIGLVAIKLIFQGLGADALGIVLFTQTLNLVLVTVLDLGIAATVVREVASHVEEEPGYVRALLRLSALVYWLAWLVLAILLLAAAPLVVRHWLVLRSVDAATATAAFRILAVASLLSLPRSLYANVFRGLQRMGSTALIETGTSALQQAAIIVALWAGGGLLATCWAIATVAGLSVAVYMVAALQVVPVAALAPGWSPDAVRRIRRFSAQMMSITVLGMVHSQVDKLTVSKLLPVATLGTYSFASSLMARVTVVTNAIAEAALPSLSSLFSRGERSQMLVTYDRTHDIVVFGTFPIYAGLLFASGPLFRSLFGVAGGSLVAPSILLALGFYLNGALTMPYVFSVASGRPDITARQNLLALSVVLPAALVGTAWFGMVGAAASWAVYPLFCAGYGIPRISRACLGRSPWNWYRQVAGAALVGGTLYGLAGLAAGTNLEGRGHTGAVPVVLAFVVASALFAAASHSMLQPASRVWLREHVRVLGRDAGRSERDAA